MGRKKADQSSKETTFTAPDKLHENGGKRSEKDKSEKDSYSPCYQGPTKNRSCTDILCCPFFVIFLAGLAALAGFAYWFGDPELLLYPRDSDGNLCGQGSKKNEKYLFFFDLSVCARMGPGVFINGCPTPQVCVKACPNTSYVFLADTISQDKSRLICRDNINWQTTRKTVEELVADKECAPYYFNSEPVINRCLPIKELLKLADKFLSWKDQASGNTYNISDSDQNPIESEFIDAGLTVFKQFLNAKEFGEKVVADVISSWWMILVGLGVAMVISLIWIILMRWIAGFMVWLTILAFVALWIGLTAVCWYFYFDTKGTSETYTLYLGWRMTFEKENLFLAGGIVFGVILLIVLLILLFLCSRIVIAIALIKHSSRAVGAMWFCLLWPLFPFILQLGVVGFWGSIAVYLMSMGRNGDASENELKQSNGSYNYQEIANKSKDLFDYIPCDVNDSTIGDLCVFIKYGKGDYTIYLQIFNLFMLFWLVNFVSALGQLTLSGAFASWYWAFNKPKDVPTFPVLSAFLRCFRYHLGSLAFGSLLIAIVQLIRAILEYLDHKLNGSENPAAKFFLKCLKCCFYCLEKILKYICKNAFIMMAVYGKNFCRSAVRAFKLIMTNCVRAFVLDKVTDFLLFVSKLVVVGAVGVIAYFFFDGRISFLNDYRPRLNFYLVPIIIVIIAAYIIADIFFSVYEMAVDTVFLCFLDDIDRNDGSQEKPYFMSKSLMKILGKKNFKKLKDKQESE